MNALDLARCSDQRLCSKDTKWGLLRKSTKPKHWQLERFSWNPVLTCLFILKLQLHWCLVWFGIPWYRSRDGGNHKISVWFAYILLFKTCLIISKYFAHPYVLINIYIFYLLYTHTQLKSLQGLLKFSK